MKGKIEMHFLLLVPPSLLVYDLAIGRLDLDIDRVGEISLHLSRNHKI